MALDWFRQWPKKIMHMILHLQTDDDIVVIIIF